MQCSRFTVTAERGKRHKEMGRFQQPVDPYSADLIIMVRGGNGKIARPIMGGVPVSNDSKTQGSAIPRELLVMR